MSKMFNNNFKVPDDVIERARQKVGEVGLGHELTLAVRYNNLKDDGYLYWVIARKLYKDSYVLWLYNDSQGGLFHGYYDMNFKEALELLTSKIQYIEE